MEQTAGGEGLLTQGEKRDKMTRECGTGRAAERNEYNDRKNTNVARVIESSFEICVQGRGMKRKK